MREFDRPIGKVWRRLRFQRFVSALVWSLGACLAVAAVVMAIERFAGLAVPGPDWLPLAVAGGVALVAAVLIAALSGPSRVDAAVAIDHAFQLNERLSTTLTLPEHLRESPAGRALAADTLRHVRDLDLGAKFGLRLPRNAWVPLLPLALALGIVLLPEIARNGSRARAGASETLDREQVARASEVLKKAIARTRKQAESNDLSAETEKLLAEIEKATEALSKQPPERKDKAMVELNTLTDALKDRQKQLGTTEQIGKQLQQLQDINSGPADEFTKDLARGDFAKAAEDLKQLREKLASGKMTENEKAQLRDQLDQMQQQLKKLANLDERKKQLEQALKNGGLSKEQFQKEMDKLNDQAKDLQKLQQLAQKLAQAQQAMQQGDMRKAAQQLGMTQQQLQEMARDVQELETLDQALADLQDAKNGMAGDGMNQLGDDLPGMNGMGMSDRFRMGPGQGGRGIGEGDRAEAPDSVAMYGTKDRQEYRKGKAVAVGQGPPGAQVKGESLLEIQEEGIESAGAVASEALSNQKVPKSVQKHVLNYFDQIRKGN